MTCLKFEGEIQALSENQIQYLSEVLQKRGYNNNKILLAPVGKVGDNYVANVLRLTVEAESDDSENFSMICKVAPKDKVIRDSMMTEIICNNEVIMYKDVLPKLASLQKNVPIEYMLRYAECYGCYTEEFNELILIEDLAPLDYKILDRMTPLPHEAIKLILTSFASLHSLSYVMKQHQPDTFNMFKERLKDMWLLSFNNPEHKKMFEALENELITIFQDEHYRNAVKALLSGMFLNKVLLETDKDSKYSVIVQGDAWTNNIMFRKQDSTLKDCLMIDYQLSREGSPVCDILYMLFNCTDHKSRVEHFHEWLDYYHEELDQSLKYFDMKADDVYPRNILDNDIKRYSKIYFSIAVMVLNVILRQPDEAAAVKTAMSDESDEKLNVMNITNLSTETFSLYKSRIQGLIDTFKYFNWL